METTTIRRLMFATCLVLAWCAPACAQFANEPGGQPVGEPSAGWATAVAPEPEASLRPEGGFMNAAAPTYAAAENPWVSPASGALGCEQPTCCCEACGGGANCPNTWYVESGVRILSRTAPRYMPLVFAANDVYGQTRSTVFNTSTLSYGISSGATWTIGRYLGRNAYNYDGFEEFHFWAANQWSNTQYVDSPDGLPVTSGGTTTWYDNLFTQFFAGDPTAPDVADGGVGGFNRVKKVALDVEHEVYNLELNFWLRPRARADRLVLQENGRWTHRCQPGWYWSHLVGFRAMYIEDLFGLYTWGLPLVNGVGTPVWGVYDIKTHNRLLGVQAGGDLMFRQCRFDWGMRYRFAPMVNLADQRSAVLSDASGDPMADAGNFDLRGRADRKVAAMAIDLGVLGSYELCPGLTVRAAYDILWVTGVSLAPEQLDFTLHPEASYNTPFSVNTGGTLFYQGLTLSAELAW